MNKPREIKFRAWDMDKKEMFVPMYLCQMDTLIVPFDGDYPSDVYPKSRPVELMQFTGLKDKHGKEIYEGDILKDPAHYPNGYQHSLNNQTGVAYYDTELGGWYITNNLTDGKHETPNPQTLQLATAKNYKVIGNIYENKELLEVENE